MSDDDPSSDENSKNLPIIVLDNTNHEPTELSKISEDANSELKSPYLPMRLKQLKTELLHV
jgi:hypothetical protein